MGGKSIPIPPKSTAPISWSMDRPAISRLKELLTVPERDSGGADRGSRGGQAGAEQGRPAPADFKNSSIPIPPEVTPETSAAISQRLSEMLKAPPEEEVSMVTMLKTAKDTVSKVEPDGGKRFRGISQAETFPSPDAPFSFQRDEDHDDSPRIANLRTQLRKLLAKLTPEDAVTKMRPVFLAKASTYFRGPLLTAFLAMAEEELARHRNIGT